MAASASRAPVDFERHFRGVIADLNAGRIYWILADLERADGH